jgi:hypothetical protein
MSNSKFVTGAGMRVSVNATLACLNSPCRKRLDRNTITAAGAGAVSLVEICMT